jgi:type II secretory pathway component PulM
MAKTLSAEERQSWEKDLQTLRAAVAQCEAVLQEDSASKAAEAAETEGEVIKAAAKRGGMKEGIMASRALGRKGGPAE